MVERKMFRPITFSERLDRDKESASASKWETTIYYVLQIINT